MSIRLGHHLHMPPGPGDTGEIERWEHTRLRRRMLSGAWDQDLRERLRQHFGRLRSGIIGPRSLAKNVFRKLCHELAVSYHQPPTGRDRAGGDAPDVFGREGLLSVVGLWPAMRRVQVRLIGFREFVLWLNYSRELDRPTIELVPPDHVLVWAHESAPTVPVEIWRLRWRTVDGEHLWAWDQVSIRDIEAPSYRVVEAKVDGALGEDLTQKVFGKRLAGGAYPFRWTRDVRAGQPFLPATLYHAAYPEALWDPYEGREVVDASLDVATNYTFLNHSIFKASWPQRWALGAYLAGVQPRDTAAGARSEVPADPTSIVHLEQAQPGTQPQIGQWGAGMDVESLARTVAIIERATADFDGLDSSHVVHDTANPWSAAALTITREGKREAQLKYQPQLRAGDLETIEKLCAIANLEGWGPTRDESGYLLQYRELPLSGAEMQAKREHNGELVAAGRMSVVDAYVDEHPGLSREEGDRDLLRIAEENKRHHVVPGTRPAPVVVDPTQQSPASPAGA